MRNLFLAVTAGAVLCVSAVAVDAMPSVDASGLAATPVPHVEKTVVVVTTRRVVRPARTVCTTRVGAMGRVTKVCRTVR